MWFANDFHVLANRFIRDPKIVIHGNSYIILYIFRLNIPIVLHGTVM